MLMFENRALFLSRSGRVSKSVFSTCAFRIALRTASYGMDFSNLDHFRCRDLPSVCRQPVEIRYITVLFLIENSLEYPVDISLYSV